MVCQNCGVEAYIMSNRTELAGDNSPEVQTEVFTVLEYRCRNPACALCGEAVGETRHRIYPEA